MSTVDPVASGAHESLPREAPRSSKGLVDLDKGPTVRRQARSAQQPRRKPRHRYLACRSAPAARVTQSTGHAAGGATGRARVESRRHRWCRRTSQPTSRAQLAHDATQRTSRTLLTARPRNMTCGSPRSDPTWARPGQVTRHLEVERRAELGAVEWECTPAFVGLDRDVARASPARGCRLMLYRTDRVKPWVASWACSMLVIWKMHGIALS